MSDNVATSSENATPDNLDNTYDPLCNSRRRRAYPANCRWSSSKHGQTVSIAPAEGQKPLSIMTDPNFEAIANPDKFYFGKGTFNTDRRR